MYRGSLFLLAVFIAGISNILTCFVDQSGDNSFFDMFQSILADISGSVSDNAKSPNT